MIHSICDFCGEDTDNTATLITMTPFQNFARYHTDSEPFGEVAKKRSFVMCSNCIKKHNMPNPYETYKSIDRQKLNYEKFLDNYTDVDLINEYEKEDKE